MKKRVFQIVTLAVFVILLSVTLCACSLLGSGSKDKDKGGNDNKKLSGIFPTTETPKWNSASGEIFEYREESDEESGSQKIIVIGLKKKTEKQVVIPDGVNKIDENAFAGCNNIISLVISDTVTSIGRGAFRDCTGLIGVSVGKNVSDIGDEAFDRCYKLVEVYNKSSLDIMARSVDNGNIGYYAKNVYDKADLTRLDVDDNNYISYLDGDKKTLMGYSGTGTELALPDGVTDIYHYAFAFNDSVKKLTMSKGVIMTGDGVFAGCTALKYVEFSGKITKISYSAFYGCTALNSIAVPETVTSVGENAFALCTSLTRVTVGTNVKKIEEAAFYNCYKLVEVYNKSSLDIKAEAASDNETSAAGGDNEGYGDIGRYVKHVYKESGKSRLTTDEKGFVVYADGIKKILVNYIGEETAPVLPSEVTEINDYAFYDCDKITEIKIPSGVTSIGKSAFLGCDELTEVTIPAETTSIGGDGILRDCPKLAKVSLPTSAIKALNGARVKKVVVTSGETIPEMAFSGLKEMTEIILPAGLKVIGGGAFYGCTGLTDVIIPDTVTGIGNIAFYGCTGLTDIIIPDTVTVIGFYAFADCEGMKALYYKGTAEQWNKITVSGEIGTEAKRYFYSETAPTKEGNYWRYFDGKVFVWETVHIHSFGEWTVKTPATCETDKVERRECRSCGVEQTRTVEKTALGHDYDESGICKRCKEERTTDVNLFTFEYDSEQDGYTLTGYVGDKTEVIIPKKYNDGKRGEKEIKAIGESAFQEKTALISIKITDNVTSIGNSAFNNCSGLTSVTIGSGVTSIGSSAFEGCSGLTSVTIGNSVTSISSYAFRECSGLTSITIPDSVTSIGEYAFFNCSRLTSITIPENLASIGANVFSGCVSLTDVHYNGTKEQWNGIRKAEDIGFNDGVTRTIHCTDGTIVIGDVSGGGSEEAAGE